jgi:hypothetical protein
MRPRQAEPLPLAQATDEAALVAALTAVESGEQALASRSQERLAVLLAHPSRTVRRRASGALATALAAGDVEAAFVEALLEAGDAATRWGAAFALHRAGRATARVVDIALDTFAEENGDLRWAASTVLAASAALAPDLPRRLRELATSGSPTTRKMALLCLADAGDRDVAFACGALRDEDAYVRLAAVTVLARLADDAALSREALASTASSDPEAGVRRAAAAVLERLDRARSARTPQP